MPDDTLITDLKHQLIDAILDLKTKNYWSQVEMAKHLGMAQPNLSELLNKNSKKATSLSQLIKVYVALGGTLTFKTHSI